MSIGSAVRPFDMKSCNITNGNLVVAEQAKQVLMTVNRFDNVGITIHNSDTIVRNNNMFKENGAGYKVKERNSGKLKRCNTDGTGIGTR